MLFCATYSTFRKELIPLGAWPEIAESPLVDNCSKKGKKEKREEIIGIVHSK